eukprot:GEMP01048333.1.p1 GENE.GEMP01048333.1~~GEMP01048333.1.p1  ORF type:complete len:130 (+),score=1.11 GEMP01048333.1:924-1313(+)
MVYGVRRSFGFQMRLHVCLRVAFDKTSTFSSKRLEQQKNLLHIRILLYLCARVFCCCFPKLGLSGCVWLSVLSGKFRPHVLQKLKQEEVSVFHGMRARVYSQKIQGSLYERVFDKIWVSLESSMYVFFG